MYVKGICHWRKNVEMWSKRWGKVRDEHPLPALEACGHVLRERFLEQRSKQLSYVAHSDPPPPLSVGTVLASHSQWTDIGNKSATQESTSDSGLAWQCSPSVSRGALLLQDFSCLPPHSSKRKMGPLSTDARD